MRETWAKPEEIVGRVHDSVQAELGLTEFPSPRDNTYEEYEQRIESHPEWAERERLYEFCERIGFWGRNISKGQKKTPWIALLYPEPEKGGRGKLSQKNESLGIGKGYAQNLLSKARAVLAYSRELTMCARSAVVGCASRSRGPSQVEHRLHRHRLVAPGHAEAGQE